MSPDIFSSKITLKLKDEYFESLYNKKKFKHIQKYNIIFSTILLVLSLPMTILLIIQYQQIHEAFELDYIMIIQFISNGFIFLTCVLSIVITRNNNIQHCLSYMNYYLILFVIATYNYYLFFRLNIDELIYTLTLIIEICLRMSWFFLGVIDFVPGIYLQVISMVTTCTIFFVIIPVNLLYRLSVYSLIHVLISGVTYFYLKELKISYYYYLSMWKKYEWFKNVIDSMNSGFISIKDREINYCNNALRNLFKRSVSMNDQSEDVKLNTTLFLGELFEDIKSEPNCKLNTYDDVIDLIKSQFKLKKNNFLFIGTKDIEFLPSQLVSLEIYGRSVINSAVNEYEFIFNDITRSKLIEEKNAEFKYKNLFLSKIAHEFKNPLLSICELVDQVNDEIIKIVHDLNIIDTLKQIKSMSSYMIILVKDLDYFSQKNTGIVRELEMDYLAIDDLIKFCNDIVISLIKKLHKENFIRFEIIKGKSLPELLYTDEVKLKQILINLLSNSVKYTQSGTIKLRLSFNKNIIFKVEDTGKGISEAQKDKLFIPFSNEFDKLNKISSGLGLSIVKELTELLGSKIEFESEVGKGSSFWFELQLGDGQLNVSSLSASTIKDIHFNSKRIELLLTDNSFTQPTNNVLIMVVDDEIVTRQSSVRLINKYLKEKRINATVVEAPDGIDCLYLYETYYKKGQRFTFILSDETMEFMNGSVCSEILMNMCNIKQFPLVPFFILTAYESLTGNNTHGIRKIFTKPLRRQNVEEILKCLEFKT
jgi:signal transduction histidine kinase